MKKRNRDNAAGSTGKPDIWSGAIGLGMCGVFFVLFAGEIVHGIRQVWVYRQTPGTVIRYVAPDKAAPDKDDRGGRIDYSYAVGNDEFRGTHPPRFSFGAPRRAFPLAAVPHKAGQALTVWYDPADPAAATLEPRIETYPVYMGLFVSLFLFIAGRLFISGWRGRKFTGEATVVVYASLATAGGFGGAFLTEDMPWQRSLAIGLALCLLVPLLTWILSHWAGARAQPGRPTRPRRWQLRREARKDFLVRLGSTLFWWGVCSPFVYASYGAVVRHAWARHAYQSVPGVVLSNRAVESGDSDGTSWEPVIRYRYRVNNREFTNDRYAFGIMSDSGEKESLRIAARFPVGATVPVYYAPGDPACSILSLEPYFLAKMAMFFMIPFIGVGVFLIGITIHALRAPLPSGVSPPPRPWVAFLQTFFGVLFATWIMLCFLAGILGPRSVQLLGWFAAAAIAFSLLVAACVMHSRARRKAAGC